MAQWYYALDEEQIGPVSAAALKRMAQAGELGRDNLIWREGMQRWAPAHKVRGLFPDENDADPQSSNAVGQPEALENAASRRGPSTDVLPVDDVDDADGASVDDVDDESSSVSGDGETAIDVLPLAGPEESKLHVPVLTAPDRSPSSGRSASDEIVVFEPASPSPPPPAMRRPASASDQSRTQDSAAERQLRVDVPDRPRGNMLAAAGMFLQTFTSVTCLLVVLVGLIVYVAALAMNSDSTARLTASAIYSTFVLASYILAHTTERVCRASGRWFGVNSEKTTQHNIRERNWRRFQ